MIELNSIALTRTEAQEIERLLAFSKHSPMEVTDLWKMMDIVWDEMGCDNSNLEPDKIAEYYSHPIWTLNGLFIEQDDVSMGHREAIANWIVNNNVSSVLDYGGGFGTLARLIASKNSNIAIEIHEPFPSQLAIKKMQDFSSVSFVDSFGGNYDCLVCIDVLEHVPNPIELFSTMIESVKTGGFLVIANCFYPVIECHLPSTFHFRYTFNQFAKFMGLQVVGPCQGSHAIIYKKTSEKDVNWRKINQLELLSKISFPVVQILRNTLSILKRLIKIRQHRSMT